MNQTLIGERWFNLVGPEFSEPYFLHIKENLIVEYNKFKCYPKPNQIFRAFQLTAPDSVKVVFLSQDPYPYGQANGIAFATDLEEAPFSLQMILRELDRDLLHTKSLHEFKSFFPDYKLEHWCRQGVLMLNSSLTVRSGEPKSHNYLGWSKFTSGILLRLWSNPNPKVFVVLGADASNTLYEALKGTTELGNHKIIEAGHPASGAHGKDLFSGHHIFCKIEKYLREQNVEPINWRYESSSN